MKFTVLIVYIAAIKNYLNYKYCTAEYPEITKNHLVLSARNQEFNVLEFLSSRFRIGKMIHSAQVLQRIPENLKRLGTDNLIVPVNNKCRHTGNVIPLAFFI